MSRILYLAHRAPYPPSGGARVRAFHCLRHLHEAGHAVTVATLTRDRDEAQALEGLRAHCERLLAVPVSAWRQNLRMLACLPSTVPSTMGYFRAPALLRALLAAQAETPFDLVIGHSSSVAPYMRALPRSVRRIMDFVDMDSQKWLLYARARGLPMALGYWVEGRKLQAEEARIAAAVDASLVVSRGELEVLRRIAPGASAEWIPNGVDLDHFRPAEAPYEPHTISFIGRFDYYPNEQGAVWFCEQVMPRLRERLPGMRLLLVGAEPSAAVRALARHPGVEVTGTVPEVLPYVQRSLATVAPLLIARGLQNKVLESMAMGVPVVASAECAKGVDAEPQRHLLVCEGAGDFVDALCRLASDTGERARLAVAGRQHAVEALGWPSVLERFEAFVERILGAPAARH